MFLTTGSWLAHCVGCQATEKQRLTTALVEVLWDLLLDLDDLSPSTASVMKLLAELYTVHGVASLGAGSVSLQELVPRLWPFLRHTIASVRLSAARTLEQLVQVSVKKGRVGVGVTAKAKAGVGVGGVGWGKKSRVAP